MAKRVRRPQEPAPQGMTLDQFAAVRSVVLGRNERLPISAGDRDEYNYVQATGDMEKMVRQWFDNDEIVQNWSQAQAFSRLHHNARIPSCDEPSVLHIHIPKTAGTTLNAVFAEHFDLTEVFYQRPLAEFLALPLGRILSLRFIGGHFGATALNLLEAREPFVVTMVREPAEHLASLRRHLISYEMLDPSVTLENWIRSAKAPADYQSLRMVVDFRVGTDLSVNREGVLPPHDMSRLRDDVAGQLERIHVVAPNERVQDVYLAMCAAAGIEPQGFDEFPVMNPTYDEEITDNVRELVAANSPIDTWLYDLVCTTGHNAPVGPVRAR